MDFQKLFTFSKEILRPYELGLNFKNLDDFIMEIPKITAIIKRHQSVSTDLSLFLKKIIKIFELPINPNDDLALNVKRVEPFLERYPPYFWNLMNLA